MMHCFNYRYELSMPWVLGRREWRDIYEPSGHQVASTGRRSPAPLQMRGKQTLIKFSPFFWHKICPLFITVPKMAHIFCAKIRWFTCKSRSEDFSSGLKRCEKFTKGETISVPIAHTHFSGKLRQMTLNKYIATPKTFYKWETKPSYWVFVSTVCSCDINQCQFLSCFLYNHKYQRRNTIQNWTFFWRGAIQHRLVILLWRINHGNKNRCVHNFVPFWQNHAVFERHKFDNS